MTTYVIIRKYYRDKEDEIIETGVSLEEAQFHCRNPETSSSTAKYPEGIERTKLYGPWFDCYDKENE